MPPTRKGRGGGKAIADCGAVRCGVVISEICVHTIFIRCPVQSSAVPGRNTYLPPQPSPLASKIATLLINCACRISCNCPTERGMGRGRGRGRRGRATVRWFIVVCGRRRAVVGPVATSNTLQFDYAKMAQTQGGSFVGLLC